MRRRVLVLRFGLAAVPVALFAVDLRAGDLRAADLRAGERDVVVRRAVLVLRADALRRAGFALAAAGAGSSSPAQFPDITRCAASATASAMSAPSRVALDATLLAACDAVSAASSPASRILRRAAGLAAIAAAAAVSPAASISLLIAAFAILSRLLLLEREDFVEEDFLEEPEERFLAGFAIA